MVVSDSFNNPADVVFVVEATANLGAYIDVLKKQYIIPTLELFNGGPPDPTDYGHDYSCTVYNMVTFFCSDIHPDATARCSDITTNIHEFITWLDNVPFIGGCGETSSYIAEGLSTALHVFDDLEQQRRGKNVQVQKHCILVCNTPPYHLPSMESIRYSGFMSEQLAKMMAQRGINLSIISPRKIPALLKLYEESTMPNDVGLSNKDFSTDPRHHILLHGFQLQERSHSPVAEAPVADKSVEQKPVHSPAPAFAIPNSSRAYSPAPTPSFGDSQSLGGEPQFKVPASAPATSNTYMNNQMPSPLSISSSMPSPQQTQQTQQNIQQTNITQQNIGQQNLGQQNIGHQQNMGQQQALNQQQNLGGQQNLGQQPNLGQQQSLNVTQQQNLTPQQSISQNQQQQQLTQSQQFDQMMAQQQQQQQQMSQQQQMQQQLQQQQISQQQQQQQQQQHAINQRMPGQNMQNITSQSNSMQLQGNGMVNMNQQAGSNISSGMNPLPGQQTQPTYTNSQLVQGVNQGDFQHGQGGLVNPGQQTAQTSQMKDRNIIWKGLLEWQEKVKPGGPQQPKVSRQLQCHLSIGLNDPDINASNWPKELIMQLIPQSLLNSTQLQPLFKNSRQVAFHFGNHNLEALRNLYKVMGTGFAGCVHFPSLIQCDVRVLLLLFSNKRKAFIGLIPNDQAAFVQGIRSVIYSHKMKQKQNLIPQQAPGGQIPSSSIQFPGQPANLVPQGMNQNQFNMQQQPPNTMQNTAMSTQPPNMYLQKQINQQRLVQHQDAVAQQQKLAQQRILQQQQQQQRLHIQQQQQQMNEQQRQQQMTGQQMNNSQMNSQQLTQLLMQQHGQQIRQPQMMMQQPRGMGTINQGQQGVMGSQVITNPMPQMAQPGPASGPQQSQNMFDDLDFLCP